MKIGFGRGLAVRPVVVCALSVALAAGAGADDATDAAAADLFDQLDVVGLYKDGWLSLQETSGENLKWLQYDTDYDNHVTKKEFLAGYAKGLAQPRPTDAAALAIFKQLDQGEDGSLYGELESEANKPYKRYDLNGNWTVSVAEFLEGYAKDHATDRATSAPAAPTPPTPARQWQAGDDVEYEWNGNWYPATVLGTQDGQYQIHFKDWPEGSFELVTAARVRPRPAPSAPLSPIANPIAATTTSQSTSGPFKVGDIVESTPYTDMWDKRHTFAARIIAVQAGEPKYQLRMLTAGGQSRDVYNYSERVRRPHNDVYDDYDPRLFIGTWRVGRSATSSTTITNERDTSIGTQATETTQHTAIAATGTLTINPNGTYLWKPATGQTLTGRWIKAENVDYPITLLKAYNGHDWGVGPHGREEGVYNIVIHDLAIGDSMWGPPIGPVVSVPPLMLGQKPAGAAATPPSRWKAGDKIEVNWKGEWRAAVVRDVENGKYQIRYDTDSVGMWDEWVEPTRIRPRP